VCAPTQAAHSSRKISGGALTSIGNVASAERQNPPDPRLILRSPHHSIRLVRGAQKKKSKPRVARRRCCRAVQGAAAACARCSTPAIASQACAEHRHRGSCRSSWNYGRIWRHAATRHVLERAHKSRGRGPQLIHAVSRRTIIAVTDKSKPHIHAGIKSCEQFQRSRHHMHVIMYYFRKSAVGRGGLYKNQDTPITSFA
jgi:hypothetical protein